MATAAEKLRDCNAERLEVSSRQLRKYIETDKPIVRVIKEKIRKVTADRDDLLASHHAYAIKANIELSDATMREFIDAKLDDADELLDKAEERIENQNSLQESEVERREVDLCIETLDAMLTSLETYCLNDSPAEADAIYVESELMSIQTREEHLTRACQNSCMQIEQKSQRFPTSSVPPEHLLRQPLPKPCSSSRESEPRRQRRRRINLITTTLRHYVFSAQIFHVSLAILEISLGLKVTMKRS